MPRPWKLPEWLIPLSLWTFTLLFVGMGLWSFFHQLDKRTAAPDGLAWDPARRAAEESRRREVEVLQTALDRWRAHPEDEVAHRDLDNWLQSPSGQRLDLPPATNLALGQFLILANDRWSDGLRRLAFSSNGPWRTAADLDLLAATVEATEIWVRCGDGWWDLSDGVPEPVEVPVMTAEYRHQLRERAALWYRKALLAFPVIDEAEANRILPRLRLVEPDF
jgi:hypothetical protein